MESPIFNVLYIIAVIIIIFYDEVMPITGSTLYMNITTCISNVDCHISHRCWNGLCTDACDGKVCDINEICLPAGWHSGFCECKPGFLHNGTICQPSCINDGNCDEKQHCVLEKNFRKCMCRPGFIPDPCFPETCRWSCTNDTSCYEGSICRGEVCLDFCDSNKCWESTDQCLLIGDSFLCLPNSTIFQIYQSKTSSSVSQSSRYSW